MIAAKSIVARRRRDIFCNSSSEILNLFFLGFTPGFPPVFPPIFPPVFPPVFPLAKKIKNGKKIPIEKIRRSSAKPRIGAMFGKNKKLKPENHSGEDLDVQEIFPTLQGEGPYVGKPATFIRLGGCNLACEFCDTEFESYKKISLKKILDQAKKLNKKLVVITGGEPMRQPIERLCDELVKLGFLVQIETNGTIFRELNPEVKIICSPKITKGKYHQIRPDLLARIDAFKFIISKSNKDYCEVGDVGQSKSKAQIYVQPMDEYNEAKNRANLKHAVKLCGELGYFLSLQTHKILGIR